MTEPRPILSVRGLSVVFGSGAEAVDAVRQLDFHVAEGEWYGLVGESGSGKSTVLRAVSGLLLQWSGAIEVAGQSQAPRRMTCRSARASRRSARWRSAVSR